MGQGVPGPATLAPRVAATISTTMEKWLCWATMGISGLMMVLFLLDLVTKRIPFGGLNLLVDILAAASAGVVCFLAWDALQDLR